MPVRLFSQQITVITPKATHTTIHPTFSPALMTGQTLGTAILPEFQACPVVAEVTLDVTRVKVTAAAGHVRPRRHVTRNYRAARGRASSRQAWLLVAAFNAK